MEASLYTVYIPLRVGGGATLHALACYECHEASVMRILFAINQRGNEHGKVDTVCPHHGGSSILKIAKLRDEAAPYVAEREEQRDFGLSVCMVYVQTLHRSLGVYVGKVIHLPLDDII
jgi:hypothetical protein